MEHSDRHQTVTRNPGAWRPAREVGAALAAASKAGSEAFFARLARNAVREVVRHPTATLATILAGLLIARVAMSRRPRLRNAELRRAEQAKTLAATGLLAAISLLLLSACSLLPQETIEVRPDPSTFARSKDLAIAGEQLARQRCIQCHAIHGELRPGRAPPLDKLLARHGADQLADDLVAGLPMDHGSMPLFEFNTVAAMSFVAYLESISE